MSKGSSEFRKSLSLLCLTSGPPFGFPIDLESIARSTLER
jgi:hypothetical protein